MPIYTKTGDLGETSLFGGKRVPKSAALVEAYGSVDELNSWIGLIISSLTIEHIRELLHKIQADLFIIGGSLAGWKNDLSGLDTRVTEMEVEIDAMERELTPLTNFILPGGSTLASQTHISRSVCRRVERLIVGLSEKESIDPIVIQYFNRFSDLLFVLARRINKEKDIPDVIWSGIGKANINK